MNSITETVEQEERNDWGLPPVSVDIPHNRGNVNQQVDNSVNKALPWVAFAMFLSGGAIIGLLLMALLLPALIDSKVEKAKAETRAEFADQLAKAGADMHMASTNALLAKDRTDKVAASLEARGLIKLENH